MWPPRSPCWPPHRSPSFGTLLSGKSDAPWRSLGELTNAQGFYRVQKTAGLYDRALLRTLSLTFSQTNWQARLASGRTTGSNTLGSMVVPGRTRTSGRSWIPPQARRIRSSPFKKWDSNGLLAWTNAPVPGIVTVESADAATGPWVPTRNAFATGPAGQLAMPVEGILTTLFRATSDGSSLGGGRGLWVKGDESLAYFCAGTRVRSWTPSGGLKTLASGFTELGDLYVEASGNVLVCDRGAHYVYRVTANGYKTVLAGNGTAAGGGDGFAGTATGLNGPRGIWPVSTGGFLILTHDGCQLWYLDAGGTLHLLLNGAGGRTHDGDGSFFFTPEPKISEGRSVTMDYDGNILICESDYGYVRRIQFRRILP